MNHTNPANDDEAKRKAIRIRFLNREAAEVYLLLDFLSGRADRSLRPTSDEQARSLLQDELHAVGRVVDDILTDDEKRRRNDAERDRRGIEADLKDPTQLVLRTMQIKYPIRESDADFERNAAFLMRARDVLNTRAAPATGATIAFTSMVSARRSRPTDDPAGGVTSSEFAVSAYPWLRADAERLDRWVSRWLCVMVAVLTLAIAVSAYAAWGKVMLDTLDAVRRDDGATQQALSGRTSLVVAAGAVSNGGVVSALTCEGQPSNPADNNNPCQRLREITLRKQVTHADLAAWEWLAPMDVTSDDPAAWIKTEQWATALLAVLGNYLMPILYGFLGSLAYVLRRHHDRLTAHLLSPRDRRANSIRLLLGTVIGGCIGLVYSGSGAAQSTGTLGLAITLSTSAIAFLAGYGVEGVFKALDGLITQVFSANGTEKSPRQLTAN